MSANDKPFPPDPPDGTIFEKSPGVYYQYGAGQKAWVRLDAYHSIKLATTLQSGLMASADYQKLNQLLIPPPRLTMTSDQCDATFSNGVIGLYSDDESLTIDDTLDLYPYDGDAEKMQWHLHENTYGFNFRVNMEMLVEELVSRGNLVSETVQGARGVQGDRGDKGIDRLDTGPKGETGDNGTNAPFPGLLIEDPLSLELDEDNNKAIIKIETEEVSIDENYLVVTRALIGGDACPRDVIIQDEQSPWILAVDSGSSNQLQCDTDCVTCSAALYYIDIEPVIDTIKARYGELMIVAKQTREALAEEWLRTMMTVFNSQKAALCCALENCESRKRNQDSRRYIEEMRIRAANSNFRLAVTSNADSRANVDMDAWKDCEAKGGGSGQTTLEGACKDCLFEIEIEATNDITNPVSVELSGGTYAAEITGCCIFNGLEWNGELSMITNLTPSVTKQYEIPAHSTEDYDFVTDAAAQAHFLGSVVIFDHVGGMITCWFAGNHPVSGKIKLCIWNSDCFTGIPASSGLGTGFDGYDNWCVMTVENIEWHERSWGTGATDGGLIEIGGIRWIISRPSLDSEIHCMRKFIGDGFGAPALAWQTTDDKTFLGLAADESYLLVYDDTMNTLFCDRLHNAPLETKGNYLDINTIIFPHSQVDTSDFYNPASAGTVLLIVDNPSETPYVDEMTRLGYVAEWADSAANVSNYAAVILLSNAVARGDADLLEMYVASGGGLLVIGTTIYHLGREPGQGSLTSWLGGGGVYYTIGNSGALTAEMQIDFGSDVAAGDIIFAESNGLGSPTLFDPDPTDIVALFDQNDIVIPGRPYLNDPPRPECAAYRRIVSAGRLIWLTQAWSEVMATNWNKLVDNALLWSIGGF